MLNSTMDEDKDPDIDLNLLSTSDSPSKQQNVKVEETVNNSKDSTPAIKNADMLSPAVAQKPPKKVSKSKATKQQIRKLACKKRVIEANDFDHAFDSAVILSSLAADTR